MNVIINPIETAISSCFLSTQESSVICTFNVEQKTESGSPISVTFSSEESSVQDLVRNVINNCILEKNSTTLFKIYFHEILEGNDLYSAYINCFSIVSVLSNVRISDTLASSSLYFENSIVNISLFLHQNKIMQCYIKDNIEKQKFVLAIEMCVEECRKHRRYIKNKIEEYFDMNHKGI